MLDIPDSLRSMFTAQLEERDGEYVFSAPASEVDSGALSTEETYRVAVVESPVSNRQAATGSHSEGEAQPQHDQAGQSRPESGAPVAEGEQHKVTIGSIGDQGDGITRLDGYVLIVPETEIGDEVLVEINTVHDDFAFADVVKRLDPATA